MRLAWGGNKGSGETEEVERENGSEGLKKDKKSDAWVPWLVVGIEDEI